MTKTFNYRLGFDLGYTSLGWACILLDEDNRPCGVHDFGVRIFPSGRDDKSKAPTSTERREKRGARRNRDRYLKRRKALLTYMIQIGLQPKTKNERKQLAEIEPLALRAKGVSEQLTLHELGRALFHLNQRRGFKSNRIAERSGNEDESGLKKGISTLAKQLKENQQTLGQYLFKRLKNEQSTRLKAGNNAEERWTSRQMVENEFWTLLKQQQGYHPDVLTDNVINHLHDIIFYQRHLKPQQAGLCTLIDGEERARLAYPQTQLFRILQEVNNLETIKETSHTPSITQAMRNKLVQYLTEDFSKLRKDGILSWSKIETIIGVKNVKFNLDCLGRKGLQADITTREMLNHVPDWWGSLTVEQQRQAIDEIQSAQTDEDLKQRIGEIDVKTPVEVLEKLNHIHLVDGYGRISVKAIEAILPHLQQGQVYSDACQSAGFNHSDDYDGSVFPDGNLPFYGEVLPKQVIGGTYAPKDKANPENYYGKINNPTVHMALNQFRLVLNELVKEYGCPPREIYLEMARETALSAKELGKLNSEHTKNRKTNEAINKELEKLSIAQTYTNRMKYKLWEDLDIDPTGRCCPLSGKTISLDELFSPQVEVEHIIPFSRSFDDSRNNKMVCYKSANQTKGNQTPYEVFGQTPEWKHILARAKKMAKGAKHARNFNVNKYWRFLPDAMEQMQGDEGSFLARQLNDTKYMSRMARRYAEFVTGKYPGERRVHAIKGKFTSDLRHHWELDELVGDFKDGKFTKDRTNHHHHAIDAIVIGLSDPGAIQKLAKANKNARIMASSKVYIDVPPPYGGFSTRPIKERLKTLVISHKLDHKNPEKARRSGTSIGQLHEDTNYGHVCKNLYATRKPLSVDNFASQKHIGEIASPNIREAVGDIFARYADIKGKLKSAYKKDYFDALESYKSSNNIKKVRIHLHKDNLIPIHDRAGKAYRHVIGGNNFCAEIWVNDKGKKAGKWQCEVIRNFDINQKGFMPRWRTENPTAMKVMRLQINDMVAIDRNGKRVICRVQKMAMSGQIILRYHNDSTTEKKTEISVAGSSLQKQNARKIFVSPTGKIYDPGHAKRPKWNK
ncbi:MAG: type II CRISPR RNA-guided endonuclease Cas9 [Gammaproteobacteria bacterium]|nr:MAG: type II CRISPR RNA-guided endonuclease Cas9 [Gammaproteobacteria bacterium]